MLPTRRELVLLSALLLLLFFFHSGERHSLQHLDAVIDSQVKGPTYGHVHYPEERLSWKNSIPETKIIAHVPGKQIYLAEVGRRHLEILKCFTGFCLGR